MSTVIECYRFVTEEMQSKNGSTFWVVGKWNKHDGILKICNSGFHACLTPQDSLRYILGDRWFQAEARGEFIHDNDKFVASEMRLTREIPITVIKRFALTCARQSLEHYTAKYPDDNRIKDCLEATENYLNDPKPETLKQLKDAKSAARLAAWSAESAARSAAWSAAWSAAREWQNETLTKLIEESDNSKEWRTTK